MTVFRASWVWTLSAATLLLAAPPAAGDSTTAAGPISGLLGTDGYELSVIGDTSALAPMDGIGTAGWREAPWSTPRWQTPLLSATEGGFTGAIWAGSDPGTIGTLLAELPSARDSATAFLLTRRLLLSASEPPSGFDPTTWLSLRVERLAALADIEGLERLLALLPADQTPALRRLAQLHITLLRADRRTLCGLFTEPSQAAAGQRQDSEQEIKIAALCRLEGEDLAGFQQALSPLRGVDPNDGFLALAEAILSGQGLSAILAAKLSTAELDLLDAQLLHRFDYEAIRPLWGRINAAGRVALNADMRVDLRLRTLAREWAVATHRASAASLAQAYADFPFFGEDLAAGFGAGQGLSGATARAFAWQSLQRLRDPGERLATVSWALDSARKDWTYGGAARVLLPRLDFSPEAASIPGVSDLAGRALYVMGRYEEATAWLLVARREGAISAQAANATWRLWPYASLAGLAMPNEPMGLMAWRSTQGYEAEDQLLAREALLLELLRALGDGMNTGWFGAPEQALTAPQPQSQAAAALTLSSMQGHSGETLARVLNLLGDWNRTAPTPSDVALAVQALDRIGLPLEARALAIESAHRAGI
ncbi:MAG: hypothetical protein Kilf2KO_01660 [Rhodospirillales bacterium]